MVDLVVTCPKGFWREWIAEGDAAGDPYTGEEWGWYMGGRQPPINAGDRLYVVAWGRLRGFAPVTRLRAHPVRLKDEPLFENRWVTVEPRIHVGDVLQWCICRRGNAQAVTIEEAIPGFRGWRKRWWPRETERTFPDWKTAGVA